ncbi:MAG: metallophosphoesterase [bacterium]|nr:metallophosphoesterase [bacterium]
MRKIWLLLAVLIISAQAREDDFTFVILGDRTGSHQDGVYEAVVAKSLSERADFYMTVGDQIEGWTAEEDDINAEWAEYFKIIEPVPVVIHLTPGNHDIWDDASLDRWREWTGCEPNYSFDYSGVHFVVLDTSRWYFTVNLPEATFDWLEEDLDSHDDARLTLIFTHKPLIYNTLTEGSGDRLHKIFLEHGVDGVFTGHIHTYGRTVFDGIPYVTLGTSGGHIEAGDFFQYAVVKVSGESYTLEIVPLESEARYGPDLVSITDLKTKRSE